MIRIISNRIWIELNRIKDEMERDRKENEMGIKKGKEEGSRYPAKSRRYLIAALESAHGLTCALSGSRFQTQ